MRFRQQSGVTIVEVMVGIAVLAIVAGIGVPAIMDYLPDYRLSKAARDLASMCQTARMTAIRGNSNCTVTFYQAVGDRTYDYVVFQDTDSDFEYDAGERILARVLWQTDYKGVRADTTQGGGNGVAFSQNDDGVPCVGFASNGVARNNSGAYGGGSVFLTNINGKKRRVDISPMGSVAVN